ncbi:MAG: hypothetical protein ACKVXR_08570 [Planctomycetota bacterium]
MAAPPEIAEEFPSDHAGKRISPLDVYPASEPAPFAQFNISVIPTDSDPNRWMSGLLPTPFVKSLRVHGLLPGRVYMGAQVGPGLVADHRRVSRVDGAQPAPFDVGARDSIEIALVARLGLSGGRPAARRDGRASGAFVLAEVPPGMRLFGEEPGTDLHPSVRVCTGASRS